MKPIWLKVAECPIRSRHYQAAVTHCLRTGKVDAGEAVDRLEAEFAKRLGVPRQWCLAVQSCTAGMGMCFEFLRAHRGGIQAPAITWPGSYCMGRQVEFYDAEPWHVEKDLVVLVDMYGAGTPKVPSITSPRARYVIDAAHNVLDTRHAVLLKGGLVQAVVYSFGAVKQLSGIRGGMVVSPDVNDRWRAYRHYGVLRDRIPEMPEGGNFDMNEFSAALVLAQLEEWEESKAKSLELMARYQERLAHLRILETGSGHLFTVWSPKRDLLLDALRFEGIETSVHYKLPAWLRPLDYPRSREWANTVLTLPLHSYMDLADVDRVCEVVEANT